MTLTVEAMLAGELNSTDTTTIHLTITGEPIAQPRHRVRRMGNNQGSMISKIGSVKMACEVEAIVAYDMLQNDNDSESDSDNGVLVKLDIKGEVVAQPRHRARRLGGRLLFFDPASRLKVALKREIRSALMAVGITAFPAFI